MSLTITCPIKYQTSIGLRGASWLASRSGDIADFWSDGEVEVAGHKALGGGTPYVCARGVMTFDISSIPPGAAIESMQILANGNNFAYQGYKAGYWRVVSYSGNSNPAYPSDYAIANFGEASMGQAVPPDGPASSDFTVDLNAVAAAYLSGKTSEVTFGLRCQNDVENLAPTAVMSTWENNQGAVTALAISYHMAPLDGPTPPPDPGAASPVYGVAYGTGGSFLGIVSGWRSLTVKRVVNGPAQATIELDGYHEAIPLLNLDAQVQMWRANPLLGIKAYKECDLLFQNGRFDWDERAQSVFIATLVGLENLLERRILLGGDDQAYCRGGYPAEQAMKALVQVQCGLSGIRNLISGAVPGLSVAPNQSRGATWAGYQLGEKALTYLQGIAEAKSMALKVTSSAPGQFVFDAYPTPYGADRTASNINPATGRNAAGNTPVIFSQQRGNAAAMSYINKRGGEGNVAIDIDAGLVFASPGETDSPWNHREFAINPGADESTEDYAAGALEKMKATEDIELTIVQTPTCAYGRDYFLGDWISVYIAGPKIKKTMHKVVSAVTWTVKPQQGQLDEQVAIELSSGNVIKKDALQEILANYGKRIKRLEMNQ